MLQSGDVMGFAVTQVIAEVERRAHSEGWDQPPMLFTMRRSFAPPDALEETPFGDMLLVTLSEVGDDHLLAGYSGADIAGMLTYLATSPQLAGFSDAGPEVLGWVLLNEAYALLGEQVPDNVDDDVIQTHQNRIEIRFVLAVDRAGYAYQVMRRRDTDERTFVRDDPSGLVLDGRITDALRLLTDATT